MKLKLHFKIGFVILIMISNSCQENSDKTSSYKQEFTNILKKVDNPSLSEISKKNILDSLYNCLLKTDNDSIQRNLLIKIADKHYYANRYEEYKAVTHKILHLAKIKKDSILIAKALYYLGDYHERKDISDSAISYYNKAENIYLKLHDTLNIGRMKLYKACILLDNGIYTQSETEGINALQILSSQNNPRLSHTAYNVVAISLKELNEFKKSLYYFNRSIKLLDDKKYPKEDIMISKANSLNNIGRVYEKSKNYNEAIRFFKKGLEINGLKSKYPGSYAMLLDNMGYSLTKAGNLSQARPLLLQGLHIRDSLNLPIGLAASKINLGEYSLAKGDTIRSLSYLIDGYHLAQKLKSSSLVLQALELLMNNDKYNKANYTRRFILTKDSLQQLERITKNKFARIAYETDEIEEENQLLSKRITYIVIIAVTTVFIFGIFFIMYRLKSKNKELFFIKEQQEANEKIYQLMLNQQSETETARKEERNRIAMELHDGIVNRIFTTRFNLMNLDSYQFDKKKQLVNELKNAENEIRRVSHDLQQNLLFEDAGFSELISKLVANQQNEYSTKFDLTIDRHIDWNLVSGQNKIQIYRIIQEAIQNVNKYSKAERCYLLLMKTANKNTIRIWDNGIGFNPGAKRGIGLKNIKERTKILNGKLEVTSSPGNGTTLEVIF